MTRKIREGCPHPDKIGHKTLDSAFRQLHSLERDGKGDGKTWPYPCPCGSIHLGHRSTKPKLAAKYETWLRDNAGVVDGGYTTNQAEIKARIKKALRRKT